MWVKDKRGGRFLLFFVFTFQQQSTGAVCWSYVLRSDCLGLLNFLDSVVLYLNCVITEVRGDKCSTPRTTHSWVHCAQGAQGGERCTGQPRGEEGGHPGLQLSQHWTESQAWVNCGPVWTWAVPSRCQGKQPAEGGLVASHFDAELKKKKLDCFSSDSWVRLWNWGFSTS